MLKSNPDTQPSDNTEQPFRIEHKACCTAIRHASVDGLKIELQSGHEPSFIGAAGLTRFLTDTRPKSGAVHVESLKTDQQAQDSSY